jgi:NADH dehydrogenase FAD-containing subunit
MAQPLSGFAPQRARKASVMTRSDQLPHVVIVGGGFGGLAAARALRRAPVRITIIDRANHHLFQPLLYQVATAALSPAEIAAPIRRVFRNQANVSVMLAEAAAIDVREKRVILVDGSVEYDTLIVATGATRAYFGHEDWTEHAPGLKTLKDALEIRRRVLLAFEVAEREPDDARRRAWMTCVIVGAGPTGVELAGTLAEVSRQTLARDFRHINKGMLATIGRGAAVARIGPVKASGFLAWLLWLFVHILFLIGFRNRLIVMLQWAWSYVTFDRGARLITEPLTEALVASGQEGAPSCRELPTPAAQ